MATSAHLLTAPATGHECVAEGDRAVAGSRDDRARADGFRGAPRTRIWVQHVAVETDKLQMRVAAARARGMLTEHEKVIAEGVWRFADKARAAAFRDDPIPGNIANWWRGTLVEAAYRNMHAARAQIIDLYSSEELRAEIPMVVARANAALHRDDPRRISIPDLEAEPLGSQRARMRRIVGDSYEQLDLKHAQLRSFRNILLIVAGFIVAGVVATLIFVALNPHLMPFCFPRQITLNTNPSPTAASDQACPTSSGLGAHPSGADVLVVAVLGGLGGSLAATLSIRNLKGTSTPYDVPVALAFLKVPLGALTAMLGLIAIQGNFIPGLSALDSQGQILAYAVIFGFAQQALTHYLDAKAQTLVEDLPGGAGNEPTPPDTSGTLSRPPGTT